MPARPVMEVRDEIPSPAVRPAPTPAPLAAVPNPPAPASDGELAQMRDEVQKRMSQTASEAALLPG